MNLLCYLPKAIVGEKVLCEWMIKNILYVFEGTSPDGTVYVDIVVSLGIFVSWSVQMSLHWTRVMIRDKGQLVHPMQFWKTGKKSSPVI